VELKPKDKYSIILLIMILTQIFLLLLQGTTVAETSADPTTEEGTISATTKAELTTVDSPTSLAGMYN
jgi:hypothetical protein